MPFRASCDLGSQGQAAKHGIGDLCCARWQGAGALCQAGRRSRQRWQSCTAACSQTSHPMPHPPRPWRSSVRRGSLACGQPKLADCLLTCPFLAQQNTPQQMPPTTCRALQDRRSAGLADFGSSEHRLHACICELMRVLMPVQECLAAHADGTPQALLWWRSAWMPCGGKSEAEGRNGTLSQEQRHLAKGLS